MIDIKCFRIGVLQTNCYLITDRKTGDMAVIDPGFKSEKLLDEIKSRENGELKYILLTHGHFDHISGVKWLKNAMNADVYIGVKDSDFTTNPELSHMFPKLYTEMFKADKLLKEGDVLTLGDTEIKVIETPGHTAGGLCYITDNCIFCGDTLFQGSAGRTDLPTGSDEELAKSLRRLSAIEENLEVYPGHGEFTTLDEEKRYNVYMASAHSQWQDD